MTTPGDRAAGMASFFAPGSIAVAGVSSDPEKMGSIIFANLLENRQRGVLGSSVYAINPTHGSVMGQRAYASVGSLPEVPELLVIAVPGPQALGVIESAAKAGVKAAIVVTSGYAEAGRADAEARMAEISAESGMRILGPNTIGVVDMASGVDTLFLRPTKTLPDGTQVASLLKPLRGGIAIVSQSGHLGQALIEELTAGGVGIRALVGTGNQADVSAEDVMEYFADDPETKVIVLYLEGVRDGRKFLSAARRASRSKPVVVFKAGKTPGGARAALTHTASLVGNYDVYSAAFRQAGVVEAASFQELADFAMALLMLPKPAGGRLAVVTNAGGVGTIAIDEAQEAGLRTDPLGKGVADRIRSEFKGSGLVYNAALGNPVDLTASVSTEELVRVVEEVVSSDGYDLGVVLPTHQTPGIDPDVAIRLIPAIRGTGKPVCVCVVGRSELASRIHLEFMKAGIPSFPTPERAVRALAAALKYAQMQKERTSLALAAAPKRNARGTDVPFTREELASLLASHGVGEPHSMVIKTQADLMGLKKWRFPVACKLLSPDLPHKADVGGVVLGVRSPEEAGASLARFQSLARKRKVRFGGMLVQEMVEDALELIVGCTRDPTFGPVVAVGLGGTYTELVRGLSLAVAPVTPAWAKSMISGGSLGALLKGYRGGPRASTAQLAKTVSKFSQILLEHPEIQEIEVNPLMARGREMISIDARAARSA
ncbi:MAG: acetate--CoA ligase family protein [Nitrososphaerota archaeon]|nr:acetate--CoA ligase family protein [Nitrososphaerota archaeon]